MRSVVDMLQFIGKINQLMRILCEENNEEIYRSRSLR